ncbi:MAG TPA: glycosyltransferase, partial [Steroidobacteraceae bacterium]
VVSIIVPVFDRLAYLRAAIDSILEQSFQDWELIIGDDGSGPETLDYLRTLEHVARVQVLQLAHSGNPAVVRNAALRRATGTYVAFQDSDDVWMPDKLLIQVAALRSRTACHWSYTGFTLVDDCGQPLTGPQAAPCPAVSGRIFERLLREQALVVTPSVVVRRELINELGGYNESLQVCEDYELWLRLALRSNVDFIDQPLVLIRRHSQHSFDDLTCLENLRRTLEIVQHSAAAPHLHGVLDERRAKISANMARGYALRRHRVRALATLLSSARYSWRYPYWWRGALLAGARAISP